VKDATVYPATSISNVTPACKVLFEAQLLVLLGPITGSNCVGLAMGGVAMLVGIEVGVDVGLSVSVDVGASVGVGG
jgi:hypothetical protein